MSSFFFFFFKQKTAYEMRISDWSSDVCSSDLRPFLRGGMGDGRAGAVPGVGGSRVGKRRGTRRRPRLGGAGLALLGGIPPDRGSRPAPRPADAPGKAVAGAGAPAVEIGRAHV